MPSYLPLAYGSPAVDLVPLADCPPTDVVGDDRPQGSGACDAGSYESPLTAFTLGSTGAPGTAVPGTAVTYTLKAANGSSTTPQHAVITDTLPSGATLSSANVVVAGGASQSCTGTTTIVCAAGALRRGEQAVATITAVLNTPGANTNSATVASELPDVNDALGAATTTTVVSGGATAKQVISRLALSPSRWREGSTVRVRFSATVPGRARFTVTRSESGVISHGRCDAPPRKRKHGAKACTRAVKVGTISLIAVVGVNRDRLPARIDGHTLKPAKYHLTLGSLKASFTVLPPAKKRHRH